MGEFEHITVCSGYRLRFLKQQQIPFAWEELKGKVAPYANIIPATLEPWFVDDEIRAMHPMDILLAGLQAGEFIICIYDDPQARHIPRQSLVGLAWLNNINHERSAHIEGWVNPAFRTDYKHRKIVSKFFHMIIDYAFNEYGPIAEGKGLGLKKLKATVARPNYAAYRALRSLGFVEVGMSPLDGLYHSTPTDTLNLELLNPDYFGLAEPEVLHAKRITAESPVICPPSALHGPGTIPSTSSLRTTAGPASDDPTSDQWLNSDGSRGGDRIEAPAMAPILKPKSNGPRGKKPVREQLLPAEYSPTASTGPGGSLL